MVQAMLQRFRRFDTGEELCLILTICPILPCWNRLCHGMSKRKVGMAHSKTTASSTQLITVVSDPNQWLVISCTQLH